MISFEGKTVLVTGAGSGIGEAIAALFAELGGRVMIAERNAGTGSAVRDALAAKGDVDLFIGDVSDPSVCEAAIQAALDRWGSLDVLVNNAGGGRLIPTEQLSNADWREMQAGNIDTTFFMSRAALRPMLAQGHGAIVNIASVHGHVGMANHAAYGAAKGAVANLTRAMAVEFASRNIRINTVSPGVIRTPAFDQAAGEEHAQAFTAMHPIGRLGAPIEVAQAVCFLASDRAGFITGANLMVDGGFSAQ